MTEVEIPPLVTAVTICPRLYAIFFQHIKADEVSSIQYGVSKGKHQIKRALHMNI